MQEKLANFTVINSGQIDADPENIGTVSWTYQAEMGNDTALGTGGGKLHNGWRQMSGEAILALLVQFVSLPPMLQSTRYSVYSDMAVK